MSSIPPSCVVRNGQAVPPRKRATPSGGGLLLAIRPGLPLTVRCIGLTESEGVASELLAQRLRPQLDALEAAVRGGAR